MLVIRREQMEVFRRLAREQFENQMSDHLRKFFPAQLAHLDDRQLSVCITRAIDRAAGYGLTTRRSCGHFLNLAATFGWDFDTREENAWIGDWLSNPELGPPASRLLHVAERCKSLLRSGRMRPSSLENSPPVQPAEVDLSRRQ
jgi:hypothetical protein